MKLVAVVKRECPTCSLVEPVLKQLDASPDVELSVFTQDDPTFPSGVASVAFDSKGNLYTGETFEGKRIQKWMPGR